jgi:hypothetical protein
MNEIANRQGMTPARPLAQQESPNERANLTALTPDERPKACQLSIQDRTEIARAFLGEQQQLQR